MSVSFLEFDGYVAPVWICDTCGAAIGRPAMRSSSQIPTAIALARSLLCIRGVIRPRLVSTRGRILISLCGSYFIMRSSPGKKWLSSGPAAGSSV